MTYTLLEFSRVRNGEPVHPANKRTDDVAFDDDIELDGATVFVVVIPDADCYVNISRAGTAAAAGDLKVAEFEAAGAHVTSQGAVKINVHAV